MWGAIVENECIYNNKQAYKGVCVCVYVHT